MPAKKHWCPWCKCFVEHKVEERGYYLAPRIVCPKCDKELGTPDGYS